MNLPTLLVIVFLMNGDVYSEVAIAPNMDICNKVQLNVKDIIKKNIGKEPEALYTSCVKMKPLSKDA